MFNSIQQFETAGIKNLRKAEDEFIRTRGMANFINAIKEVVLHLGLDVIAETLENYDAAIRKSTSASRRMQRPASYGGCSDNLSEGRRGRAAPCQH